MFLKKQSVYAILALFLFAPAQFLGVTKKALLQSIGEHPIEDKEVWLYAEDIIRPILENEVHYEKDYVICYHGMSSDSRLFMEVLRNLYEEITQKPLRADFEFLRFWNDGSDYNHVNDFLNGIGSEADDDNDHIRQVLVSVNFDLLGNPPGEDTWGPFLKNEGQLGNDYARKLLEGLFEKIGCDKADIAALLAIKNDAQFKTKTGDILQIIIPKNIVSDCAYIATPGGESIVDLDDHGPKKKEEREFFKVYNKTKGRQARLFFAKSGPLLNPEYGVKIIDFNTLEPEKLAAYKQAVKDVVHNIVRGCTKLEKPMTIPLPAPTEESSQPLTKEDAADIENIMKWIREYFFAQIVMTENPIPELRKSLAQGTPIDIKFFVDSNALATAIEANKVDVIEFLLKEGANPNAEQRRLRGSLLGRAIRKANLPVVKLLITHGGRIKHIDYYGKKNEPIKSATQYTQDLIQEYPRDQGYAEILAYVMKYDAAIQLLRVRLYPTLDFAGRRNLRAILKRINQKKPDAVELFTTIVKHLAVNEKEQARDLTQNAYGGSSYWGGDFPASNLEHKEWQDAITYALDNANFSFLTMYHPDQQEEQDLHLEQQKQEEYERSIQEEMLKPLNRGSTS